EGAAHNGLEAGVHGEELGLGAAEGVGGGRRAGARAGAARRDLGEQLARAANERDHAAWCPEWRRTATPGEAGLHRRRRRRRPSRPSRGRSWASARGSEVVQPQPSLAPLWPPESLALPSLPVELSLSPWGPIGLVVGSLVSVSPVVPCSPQA